MIHADVASGHVVAGPRPVSQITGCTDTKHVAGAMIVRPCVLMLCLELNMYGICLTLDACQICRAAKRGDTAVYMYEASVHVYVAPTRCMRNYCRYFVSMLRLLE